MDFKAVLFPPKELFQMVSGIKKERKNSNSFLLADLPSSFFSSILCINVSIYASMFLPPFSFISFHLSSHHVIFLVPFFI